MVLELADAVLDLALFNTVIDSKFLGCGLAMLTHADVFSAGAVKERTSIMQSKSKTPVRFEFTEGTRKSLVVWISHPLMTDHEYLWPATSGV
uniref:hypothetical protein n=1 Tax=Pararhizobium sp. IMCC3301 TaxID=3067904 RepID=UPI0027414467|nr:hypothetical protein [Pararhizobium sp. IMCC3301]